jgi:hypothetical protein
MRIQIHTTPNSKKALVEMVREGQYRIKVNAKAVDGAANIRLIEILAEHFKVPFGAIRILSGATSRDKVVEIIGG